MTENQRRNWYKFCSEPLDKIEHYEEALAEGFKCWCIHHRLEIQPDGTRVSMQELKSKGLYYSRPARELIFMRFGEHSALHSTGNAYMKWHKHSADTRRKMSEAKRGKHLSSEHRKKLSEAQKGKHLSAETCKKMSESKKGENNPFFGLHRSAETRLKMSEAHKGKNHSDETRLKMSEAHKSKHWYNNGVKSILAKTCPEGFVPGRLK